MRIVQITPGSGPDYYCENCLRDAALVRALRAGGHDVLLVPLYLPLQGTAGTASGPTPVFFGGINVYLQQKLALFRRTPRWIDRLFDARPLLEWAGRRAGMTRAADLGEATLSMLRGEHGRQAKELERLVEWLEGQARPDVVCLSNALLVGLARQLRARLGTALACFLQDEDAFLDALPEPHRDAAWATVRERLSDVDALLPVSRYYAEVVARRLGPAAEHVHLVRPGIDLGAYAPALESPAVPTLGYLAQMSPAKGLDVLVEAYLAVRRSGRAGGVRLRVAGGCTAAEEPFVEAQQRRLAEAGAGTDATFLRRPDARAKAEMLRTLSVLCVPDEHGEAFPLYVLEALASGVPVVGPRCGAMPELAEATGGVTLYEPGKPTALAEALEALLLDPEAARAQGARGREAVAARFGAARMAAEVVEVFEKARTRYDSRSER